MDGQLWSWILTLTGVTTFFLAGKKIWWAWHVGLFINQPIWLMYGIVTEQWGFIASTLFYTAVYSKNAYAWTLEHRDKIAAAKTSKVIGRIIDVEDNEHGVKAVFRLDDEGFREQMSHASKSVDELKDKLWPKEK